MRHNRQPLRIAVLAPLRYPIREPFAGGLESAVWNEVRDLRARGHEVTLIAVEGSDFLDPTTAQFTFPAVSWPPGSTPDEVGYPDGYLERALPRLTAALHHIRAHSGDFDVISNHCLHPLPLQYASELGVPMVSTLHTPVLVDLVAAHRMCPEPRSSFIAVSEHTADEWRRVGVDATVVHNSVNSADWTLGAGGDGVIWFGRLVPEKGAHLAIEAARILGRPLDIVGRVADRAYVESEILPRLSSDIRLIDPRDRFELGRRIGSSACALVTPLWQEPFGLVAPEALACGTPVAAFESGGLVEIATRSLGMHTVRVGDVAGLAAAADRLIRRAAARPVYRAEIRSRALTQFSNSRRIRTLESIFEEAAASAAQPLASVS